MYKVLVSLIAAIPCWVLAYMFLRTWQAPLDIDEGRWVSFAVGIMVLEFVLVHSGAFFASISAHTNKGNKSSQTIKSLFFLMLFYLPFGLAFAFAFKSINLLVIFFAVMASRWYGIFNDSAVSKLIQIKRSVASVALYLFVAFASVFTPVPRWGINVGILNDVYPDRGTGLWETNPERAIFAGILYFTLLGIYEVKLHMTEYKNPEQALKKAFRHRSK